MTPNDIEEFRRDKITRCPIFARFHYTISRSHFFFALSFFLFVFQLAKHLFSFKSEKSKK